MRRRMMRTALALAWGFDDSRRSAREPGSGLCIAGMTK
ncbi:hypothetical protein BSIN_4766 [Burkholderia singularis]|uniref:Uncharacterized protein n=1 Tax=Burkholderia singularis TaxID=1503053 RepID=A0A238HAF2_9BURK|nr:hypothetical protein BSIN_4766 [Burkholderia singularis]